jgi:hypothetical protein
VLDDVNIFNTIINKSSIERSLLVTMIPETPLACSVRDHDLESLTQILQEMLPSSAVGGVSDVTLSATVGEAFTGGRSTPVYAVSCTVHKNNRERVVERPVMKKKRNFIIKLVWMLDHNEEKEGYPPDDKKNVSTTQQRSKKQPHLEHLRQSYAVERRFYESELASRIRDAMPPLSIPKFLGADLDGSRPWPVACFLMNDVTQGANAFPHHPPFLTPIQAKCALRWIAHFHALFWSEHTQHKNVLWPCGGFWNAKIDLIDWQKVQQHWMGTVQWLRQQESKLARETVISLTTNNIKGLGKRLQAHAPALQEFLTQGMAIQRFGTVVHGDYKAANLFFKDKIETQDDAFDQGANCVCAVDFQYTGGGIGAMDVAYLLYPDARGGFWESEEELLITYHETLIDQLVLQNKGGPKSLPYETFHALYDLVRVQLTCYWLSKGWVASTAAEAKLVAVVATIVDQIDAGAILDKPKDYTRAFECLLMSSS